MIFHQMYVYNSEHTVQSMYVQITNDNIVLLPALWEDCACPSVASLYCQVYKCSVFYSAFTHIEPYIITVCAIIL